MVELSGFLLNPALDDEVWLKNIVAPARIFSDQIAIRCRPGPGHRFAIRGLKIGDRITVKGEIESVPQSL